MKIINRFRIRTSEAVCSVTSVLDKFRFIQKITKVQCRNILLSTHFIFSNNIKYLILVFSGYKLHICNELKFL